MMKFQKLKFYHAELGRVFPVRATWFDDKGIERIRLTDEGNDDIVAYPYEGELIPSLTLQDGEKEREYFFGDILEFDDKVYIGKSEEETRNRAVLKFDGNEVWIDGFWKNRNLEESQTWIDIYDYDGQFMTLKEFLLKKDVDVIGTIFTNPELMKEEDKK